MTSKYIYKRHLPIDYIRLLTLVSDGTTFHGFLEEFRRDKLPYFSALSWCWWSRGERQDTAFSCDGQTFPVSHHLYELLDNVNPKSVPSSVRIWIDRICINQEHINEKNVHVAHMHQIYGQAQNVVIWIGKAEDGSDLVMDSKNIAKLNRTLQLLPGSSVAQSVTPPEIPRVEDPIWKAIGRLCDRDWFYRTWVIQEIAMARKAEILCGSQWLGWDEFVDLVCSISRVGLAAICRGPRSTGKTRPDGFGVLMDLSWCRKMVQNKDLSMSYLLHMVRLKEVTKPVDKVYGLLGIISADMRGAIKVNYAENDQQYWRAYTELAEQIITADEPGFWLLCMASSRERLGQLLTWCPNLNSLTLEYLDFGHQKWRAGLGDQALENSSIHLVKETSSLQISGFQIDIVDEVFHIGGPYAAAADQPNRSQEDNTTAFLNRDSQCFKRTLHLFDDANDARDAYARTLIINSSITGSSIPQSQNKRVQDTYEECKAYLAKSKSDNRITASTPNLTEDAKQLQQLANEYITQLGWWQERPFYTTRNRRIGRGAFNMQPGDAICVFYGAGPVFILRSAQRDEMWTLVGDAYLHGCMVLENTPQEGRGPNVEFVIC